MTNYAIEPLSKLNTDMNHALSGVDSLSGYATTNSLTAYASKQYVADYVDQHGSTGDYLPLSGGDLSGRIYLKKSETIVVPGESFCVIEFNVSQNCWNDMIEDNFNFNVNYVISVLNVGQEFIDMMTNWDDYTGETLSNLNVHVEGRFWEGNGFLSDIEFSKDGTVGFGNAYCNGSIGIDLTISELEELETSGELVNLVFDEGNGGNGPSVHLEFNYNWDPSNFTEDMINSGWTAHTTSQTVTTTEPFALSSDVSCYVDAKIGDINTILDSINGQII